MGLLPPRPIRRLLLPVEVVLLLVLTAVFTVVTGCALLAAPLSRRRRALRIGAFALSYCCVEIGALIALGVLWVRRLIPGRFGLHNKRLWLRAHWDLLSWALTIVLRSARRCVGFDVAVAPTSDRTPLSGTAPVLVLARHGGPGDSFALVHLLLTRYHRTVRIVLKEALQFDPLLDLLLNRLGCCFVPSGSGGGEDVSQRLGQMARQLGPGDAILIFPEGGNWTPDRRRRAIRRLRKEKKIDAANAASLMSHVLPARPGGVLACLEANPGIDIVVVAHAGLDKITRVRQAWDELPLITPMTVRAWPTAPVPHGDDQRLAWLTLEWAVVDEWIDGFHEGVLN